MLLFMNKIHPQIPVKKRSSFLWPFPITTQSNKLVIRERFNIVIINLLVHYKKKTK